MRGALVIVVPYAGEVHARTRVSLRGQGATFVDVGGHPAAYPDLLRRIWEGHTDTVIVEHDVVVPTGAIEGLCDCPRSWCYHSYVDYAFGGWPPMGLCRIREAAMTQSPNCWERYLARRSVGLNPDTMRPMAGPEVVDGEGDLPPWNEDPPWTHCDEWLAAYLRKSGISPHRHYPDAENL